MTKKRGTSNAPMVLGIIGGVIGLPSAFCSGACGAFTDEMLETSGTGEAYLYVLLVVSVLLIVFSCFTKKFPIISGILMALCAAVGLFFTIFSFNLGGVIAMAVGMIGAILSLVLKKEVVEK